MQRTDLGQLANAYDHVYFSPHLDDAVLSCGGAILRQRQQGQRALVITLCTAAPAPEGPFNELAQEFHRFWALPPEQVVATRLREDAAAIERLGADYLWANFLDAIYRRPDAYTTRESLFGRPVADDQLLPELTAYFSELAKQLPEAMFYAPLGVGFHVDHQLTHTAARRVFGPKLVFYEDFPYAAKAGAVEARQADLNEPLAARIAPIDDLLDQKINAIAAYASQLDELFRVEPMEAVVTSYSAELAPSSAHYGERVWLRSE